MTNKLPIVGKRYRFKHYKTPYPEVEVLAITNSYAVYLGKDKHGFDAVGHCGKLVFLQDYEELPEDKAETKPAIKENLTLELSPEVKEAMEELKKAEHLLPKIYMNVADNSTIITDTLQAYKTLKKHYDHKTIKHSAGEYVKNDSRVAFKIHTNTIEGFWGELKRGIRGIYHWASHKHIQKYCNEFAYRYNNRKLKNNERFVDFLSGLANTKLTYKTLTA